MLELNRLPNGFPLIICVIARIPLHLGFGLITLSFSWMGDNHHNPGLTGRNSSPRDEGPTEGENQVIHAELKPC